MTTNISPPLTNVQFELLKLFATDISEEHLNELKNIIAKYLFEKARNKANTIWEERNYTEQTFD